jgi:hypothetical protein
VAPVVATACFSTNDSKPGPDGGTPQLDAGPGPVMDATLPSGPDASAPEAAADGYVAPLPDAAAEAAIEAGPPVVTVVVHSALGPEQNVTVVFQDASGAVLSTGVTSAIGSASALVPAGSQVTAVMGSAGQPVLTTIQGVSPGDVLAVYDPTSDATSAQVSIDLAVDSQPPAGSAYFYAHIGQCGYSVTAFPLVMSLSSFYDCQSGGVFPVRIDAQADADGGYANLGYIYQKGNMLPLDGGVASVIMTGSWSTATGTQTLVVANQPISGSSVALSEVANHVATPDNFGQSFVDEAGANNYAFPTHPGFADSLQGEAVVTEFSSQANGYHLAVTGVATRGPAAQGDAGVSTIDMSQSFPLIDHASIDSSNPAQPAVSWGSEAGALTPADGVYVAISWSDVTDAGAYFTGRWTIVAPPTSTGVTAPALPLAAQAWAPGASATFVSIPSVVVVDADFVASYAELRAQAGSLPISANILNGRSNPAAPPLPVDGTLKLTAFTLSGD